MTSRKDGALMRARASAPSGAAVAEGEAAHHHGRGVYCSHVSEGSKREQAHGYSAHSCESSVIIHLAADFSITTVPQSPLST
jgi:hypothetical protein